METVKLLPATKDYIWGGNKFRSWGKNVPDGIVAECWELSFNPDGPSKVCSGPLSGQYLKDCCSKEDLGSLCSGFAFFPMLIKLIDAKDNLSVQVHPSDDYALKNEHSYGKTEMWYVIESEPGAGLYVGFKKDISKEELMRGINDQTLMDVMNFVEVKPGDCYFIPSGTVHAIGRGVTILEIQQNSNLTYRLYDYGRLGKDGKPRELHIEKALKVIDLKAYRPLSFERPLLGRCRYFSVYEHNASTDDTVTAGPESFSSLTFVSGHGTIDGIPYSKGDSFFVPAGKRAIIKGDGKYVLSRLEEPCCI